MPGVLLCCSVHQAYRGVSPGWGSAHQSLKEAPWVGSYSVVQCVRHLMGQPLYCSADNAGVLARETQQYRLASVAARLSSTGISHHNLLLHIPLIRNSAVNSSPRLGIAPQSLYASSQQLRSLGYVWLWQGLSDSHSFTLPQTSCFTLSLKYFSSDSERCSDVRIGPLLQFPNPPKAGPVLLSFLLFPIVPWSY